MTPNYTLINEIEKLIAELKKDIPADEYQRVLAELAAARSDIEDLKESVEKLRISMLGPEIQYGPTTFIYSSPTLMPSPATLYYDKYYKLCDTPYNAVYGSYSTDCSATNTSRIPTT